jgi:hypothetical protein
MIYADFNREESSSRLKLSKNYLKHRFEFVKVKPNSDLAGKTNLEYKILHEKELVHYESLGSDEKGNKDKELSINNTNEFISEMCIKGLMNLTNYKRTV